MFLSFYLRAKIECFVADYLNPIGYSNRELKRIGESDDYDGFITGSDQVWNMNNHPEKFYFLDFTQPSKRMAFAVSIGSNALTNLQEYKIKLAISAFSSISVREETAKLAIEKVYHDRVNTISDPTVMLTTDEWRKFAKKGIIYNDDYVFMHFIDEPSLLVISFLERIRSLNYSIICFGYNHANTLRNYEIEIVDGDPTDYVSLISNARMVLTDSYHTTLFSIYFGRDFRVYTRSYQTKHSQNSRILNILRLYDAIERLDCIEADSSFDNKEYEEKVEVQRDITIKELCTGLRVLFHENCNYDW